MRALAGACYGFLLGTLSLYVFDKADLADVGIALIGAVQAVRMSREVKP